MKRKTKIIVYTTCIILTLLILLGFTYGYYLTKINGNKNSKSLEITSGDSSLLYTDLSTEDTSEIIEPGYTNIKLFTIKNIGDLPARYDIYLTDVSNSFSRKQDLTYTLYRKVGNNTIDTSDMSDCEVLLENVEYPSKMTKIKANEVIANTNDYYTYALKITYINHPTENQNIDQGKKFTGKIQIGATGEDMANPYSEGSFAYTLITNAKNATGDKSIYQETPTTTPGQAISTETEKTLSKTEDDYGDSYYYRGNVIDNFVNYAGMCWRIVRIQGDGSIKLILASELSCSDTNVTTSSGYATDGAAGVQGTKLSASYGYKNVVVGSKTYKIDDYINSAADTTGNARTKLNAWLERKITKDSDKALLKNEDWCIGDRTTAYDYLTYTLKTETAEELRNAGTSFNYSAAKRIWNTKTPTLKCDGNRERDGEIDTNKVGMLTADEIEFAGATTSSNSTYYLNKNATSDWWWVLSLSRFTVDVSNVSSFDVYSSNGLRATHVYSTNGSLRVAVSLTSSTKIISGDGTVNNAYIVG